MNAQLIALLTADAAAPVPLYASISDADAATALSTPATHVTPYYVNARTLYAIDPAQAKAALAAIQGQDANLYAILMAVGPNDGSAGGVDVSLPATQAQVNALAAAGVVTAAYAADVLARGTTTIYPAGGVVAAADVTAARALIDQRRRLAAGYNAAVAALDAWVAGAGPATTIDSLKAMII